MRFKIQLPELITGLWNTKETLIYLIILIKVFILCAIFSESFPFRYLATLIQDEKDQGIDDLAVSNVVITMAAVRELK